MSSPRLLVLGLEAPAGDEALGLDALLVVAEEVEVVGEVAHAGVKEAPLHGYFGKEHEGYVQAQGHLARKGRGMVGAAAGSPRLDGAHLGVEGERLDAFDVGRGHERRTETELQLVGRRDAQGGVVVEEEVAHAYLVALAVGFLNLEGADDGIFVAADDGAVDGVGGVGGIHEQTGTKEEFAVGRLLEIDRLLRGEFTAVLPRAGRRGGVAHGDEEFALEKAVGNGEEPLGGTVVHRLGSAEEPFLLLLRLARLTGCGCLRLLRRGGRGLDALRQDFRHFLPAVLGQQGEGRADGEKKEE